VVEGWRFSDILLAFLEWCRRRRRGRDGGRDCVGGEIDLFVGVFFFWGSGGCSGS